MVYYHQVYIDEAPIIKDVKTTYDTLIYPQLKLDDVNRVPYFASSLKLNQKIFTITTIIFL
jgi:hypothetical protein